ncbi:MAG: hypothetical protein EPO23_04875 [Xanthobacteraceae bacterium]|nr:MAG: hypothetical protein EPO23_04875 [Xanthobacteraceae bacterium]
MALFSYIYHFFVNFMLLATAYFGLSLLGQYDQRAMLAIMILIYALLRTVSVLRSFSFMHRVERLEHELHRFMSAIATTDTVGRRQLVSDVALSRHHGELKAYIDLLFLSLVALLCLARIIMT